MNIEALHMYIKEQQEVRQAMIIFSEENPLIYVLVAKCEKQNCTLFFLSQYFAKYNRTVLFTTFVYDNGRRTFYTTINPNIGRQSDQAKVAEMLYDFAVMNFDLEIVLDSEFHDYAEFDEQIMFNPTMQRMFNSIKVLSN